MSTMFGADVAELRRLSIEFHRAADELDRDGGMLTRLLNSVDWIGGVASRFTNQWTGVQLPRIGLSTRFLREAADELTRNADEQERASTSTGGRGAPVPGVIPIPGAVIGAGGRLQGGGVPIQGPGAVEAPEGGLHVPMPEHDWPHRRAGQSPGEWWASMTEAERQSVLDQRPSLAMVDGIPPDARIAATRRVMELRQAELRASGADPVELARLDVWLANPDRQFFLYDPSGDGRVAEVFGDLRTADNVAVVVPGINNDIGNFQDQLRKSGDDLWGGDPERAVIAWLGYDTPELSNPSGVVSTVRAGEAAPDLVSFTEGLRSTVGGEITVVAHSYGTVVATRAAQAGMDVDRVVLLGSPGVPADHASVFNGADVYVMNNGPADYVPYADNLLREATERVLLGPVVGAIVDIPSPGFADMANNTDPGSSSFGATVLDGNTFGTHSQYFEGGPLEEIQRVMSPGPVNTGSTIITRSVDDDGNIVVSQVGTY